MQGLNWGKRQGWKIGELSAKWSSIPHGRGKLLKGSTENELIPGWEGRLDDFPRATVFLQTLSDKGELTGPLVI